MASSNKEIGPANQYARALLELANSRGQAAEMRDELHGLSTIIQSNPMFKAFCEDPAIGRDERRAVLERTFRGKLSELLMNALLVLNVKGRLYLLPQIALQYQMMLDRQMGNVQVDLTVAQPMDEATLGNVQSRISQAIRKNAVVTQIVDESIIGGMIARVDDRLIDGSVKAQLEAMRQQLASANGTTDAHR